MSWFPCVSHFRRIVPSVELSDLFNKTYGNLEFISPGTSNIIVVCTNHGANIHGSTLAEITSEHIWKLTLMFVDEFELNSGKVTSF